MIVGNREFKSGTHIMGILNVTDDSFFEPSRLKGDLFERVYQMIRDGAEIIDIGGQSTRPGATPIKAPVELGRVLPVLKEIKAHFNIPVSIDTFYSNVADVCLDNGADMINDVTCLSDPKMAKVIANHDASVCICHNRRESSRATQLMQDKIAGLTDAVERARVAGIKKEKILLDGGIGFNHNAGEDWELLFKYKQLSSIGYPLLLGTSRKSFFGGEVEDRLNATVNTTALATEKGYLFVRVHDIVENKAAIDAITRKLGAPIIKTPEEGGEEEEKKESLFDIVSNVDHTEEQPKVEETPVEETPQEEATEEAIAENTEEVTEEAVEETPEVLEEAPTTMDEIVIQGKDEEETDGEIAPEVMEEFKQAINKYVDYKPGRGLPMRDDIKISRFGSDDDTDYSTF